MLSFILFACTSAVLTESDDKEESALPAKESHGPFQIIRLSGTPYEMGVQHGELLLEELEDGTEYVSEDPLLGGMLHLADMQGLLEFAYENTPERYIEECEGLTSVTEIVGWTMDHCVGLNMGDVIIERLLNPPEEIPGCSQLVAKSSVTQTGSMLHGRLMDWAQVDFIIENPTIFVRSPDDGIPHVIIGFPGNLSPYQGMNKAGLSVASNEAHPGLSVPVEIESGDSHVQMVGTVLTHAHSLSDADRYISGMEHRSTESIVVADGENDQMAVFEMTHDQYIRRDPSENLLLQTNHFVSEGTESWQRNPIKNDSLKRYDRLIELAAGEERLSKSTLQTILRDRIDPWSGEESELGTFDDNRTLATNGALFGIMFEPQKRRFYVAGGTIPVPEQTWFAFSLYRLLGEADPYESTEPLRDY